MITLDSLIEDILGFDKKKEDVKPTLFDKIIRRKDIQKRLEDERQSNIEKVMSEGAKAEAFLNSAPYQMFIDSQIRDMVKSSLQKVLRDFEMMTEVQLKCELTGIKRALRIPAHLKLKVISAEAIKKHKPPTS